MSRRIWQSCWLFGLALLVCNRSNAQSATVASEAKPAIAVSPAKEGFLTIHNDFYWTDQDGARILTRSGDLRKFNGVYYWYGGNPRGFREQYCYSSTDLIHWTNHGVVLRHDTDANRIDVLYNEKTKKYVMIMKYDGNGAHLGIATADKPEGPFTFQTETLVDNALMGDSSVFQDDDGKAYLCYVSWAVGTNAQHGIYRMSDDYTTLSKRIQLWDIRSREAPHIFKRNGIYYYGTSRTAGIQSSGTSYYSAPSIEGPWSPAKPLDTPGSRNSWDSQVDFIYPFKGTQGTTYMFAGDRWTKDLPKGRDGDYIWLPMEFDGDTPIVHYYQDWDLNPTSGTWRKFDPARNLAAGKPATASSETTTHTAGLATAPKTYENYINQYWESAASDPQWLMVDLGAPTEINRVILKWNRYAAKDFKIQTSANGNDWNDVYSTTQGSGTTVTDEMFPTTTARYVRMAATARAPVVGFGRGGRGRGGFGGRGGRGGRGARGAQATTQTTTQAPPAAQQFTPPPAPPAGYSLFDFEVLKD